MPPRAEKEFILNYAMNRWQLNFNLWGFVNGYRIGLQVKPSTFNSASVATYAGKAWSGQRRGHGRFQRDFGGHVFTVDLIQGSVDSRNEALIEKEVDRLRALEKGPHEGMK